MSGPRSNSRELLWVLIAIALAIFAMMMTVAVDMKNRLERIDATIHETRVAVDEANALLEGGWIEWPVE